MPVGPLPIEARREKRALRLQLLADVEKIVEHVRRSNPAHQLELTHVSRTLETIHSRSEVLDITTREAQLSASSELFQWFYRARKIIRGEVMRPLVQHCCELTNVLLVPQLLSPGTSAASIPLWIDQHGMLRIPQLDSALSVTTSTARPRLLWATLTPDALVIADHGHRKWIRIANLLSRVDGAVDATRTLGDTPVFLKQRGQGLQQAIRGYETELSRLQRQPVRVRRIAPTRFADVENEKRKLRKLDAAFGLIRDTWPELYDEAVAATTAITLVDGTHFTGGSDIAFYGVSFLGMRAEWSVATYADHIVHESAHHVLHARSELQSLLDNPTVTSAPSPIRRDARPLYGTLHATFVFYRLCTFFHRYMERSGDRLVEPRFHRHLLGFYEGMNSLEKHARFAGKGVSLFAAMRRARERMSREWPKPLPKLYNKIGNDYESPSSLARP